jgi:ferredoxin
MQTVLYYFSGTGNSLKVTKGIASGLGNAQLVPVSKAVKEDVSVTADKVGIVFPVYMWGPPAIVAEFIKKLNGKIGGKYVFSVATCGGFQAGASKLVKKYIRAQGGELSGAFAIQMPGNYTPLYGAFSKEKQEKMFKSSESKINMIVDYVKNERKGMVENTFLPVDLLLSGLFYNISMSKIHGMDNKFWVQDTCTKCGICEKVCPAKNIELKDGKPAWNHKCEQCLACLQWCPVSAIEYGKSTVGRKRYHHPDIGASEFFQR